MIPQLQRLQKSRLNLVHAQTQLADNAFNLRNDNTIGFKVDMSL